MQSEAPRPLDGPIVLFDGVCNLCNGAVNFIIDHDREARLRFASLQSETAQKLLEKHALKDLGMATMVLIEGDRIYLRARGVLRVAHHLGGVYRFAAALVSWLPTSLLDFAYTALASRRYKLFGQSDVCRVPTPELRSRFL